MKPIQIELTDTEIDVARLLAGLRIRRNREAGTYTTPISTMPQELSDMNAMGAEIAFCKWLNVYPDLTTNVRSKGADCTYWNMRIDVKQTDQIAGRLITRITKHKEDVDIYVLMRGVLPQYSFVGWCYSRDLIQASRIVGLTNQKIPTYVLPNEELRSPEDFKVNAKAEDLLHHLNLTSGT